MKVFQVLQPEEAVKLREQLSNAEFTDGKATAKGFAVDIKQNTQLMPTCPAMKALIPALSKLFLTDPDIKAFAQPMRLVNPRASRYRVGDHYDWHTDLPTMEGARTDLSFTLFLSAKDSYDGGVLELNHGEYIARFKGEPGQAIIYPTGVRHRVTEVTQGERLVIVGWIRSFIRDNEQRELLYKMLYHASALREHEQFRETYLGLQECYQGLVRSLAD